jgi:hypothetical protein
MFIRQDIIHTHRERESRSKGRRRANRKSVTRFGAWPEAFCCDRLDHRDPLLFHFPSHAVVLYFLSAQRRRGEVAGGGFPDGLRSSNLLAGNWAVAAEENVKRTALE